MGKIIRNGIPYGGTYDDAASVNYDNSRSGLSANTVQEAVDEVNDNVNSLDDNLKLKVDKVDGMGLSQNNFTTTDKNKLNGIEDGATKNVVDSSLNTTSTNAIQNKAVATSINTINTNLNNKVSNGSQCRFTHITVGAEGQSALIYNESGDNLNFRFKDANGNIGYTSIAGIMSKIYSFQNGVDTIYNGCKTYGSTPTASTP